MNFEPGVNLAISKNLLSLKHRAGHDLMSIAPRCLGGRLSLV
jgi:hypothetical protein